MVLSAILIALLTIITLFPYILTICLRLTFRRHLKSMQVHSYTSFRKISISSPKGTFLIDHVSFSISNSKVLISLKTLHFSITPGQSSQSVPLSSTKSIILRWFLSIFSHYFILKLETMNYPSKVLQFLYPNLFCT